MIFKYFFLTFRSKLVLEKNTLVTIIRYFEFHWLSR